MMKVRTFLSSLRAMDALIVLFLLILSLVNLLFSARIPEWVLLIILNLGMASAIACLPTLVARRPSPLLTFVRNWYPIPVTLVVFKELYWMVRPINPHDYDQIFIAIDRWMFGVDPTRWLAQWSHPVLTEILQVSYAMFYFLFIIVAAELYRGKRMEEFKYGTFLAVYGFYLSYVGYFIFPAVGPRFTLHDFHAINTELPGLLLTNPLRDFLNMGSSIPKNVPNPADFAQRDVFPSGHTQLTLVVMFFVYRYRLKTRHVITVVGLLGIISTVYLRYHYVIDVIAGACLMLFTIWSGPRLYKWWNCKREKWGEATVTDQGVDMKIPLTEKGFLRTLNSKITNEERKRADGTA